MDYPWEKYVKENKDKDGFLPIEIVDTLCRIMMESNDSEERERANRYYQEYDEACRDFLEKQKEASFF